MAANECHQALATFFASPAIEQLCRTLVFRALVLSAEELEEYEQDPESFVHEEAIAREGGSLRKCAERCLLTLADTTECKHKVQASVVHISNECAASGASELPTVLALDACYLAMGLVLQARKRLPLASPLAEPQPSPGCPCVSGACCVLQAGDDTLMGVLSRLLEHCMTAAAGVIISTAKLLGMYQRIGSQVA
ncbi:MAG: hypothetical protein SGPRY_006106 [Prymnesium sp.]